MSQIISKEQKRAARRADLYSFLEKYHGSDFKRGGSKTASLRMKNNRSIRICKGYAGYKDFSTGETGNAVDFLTRHIIHLSRLYRHLQRVPLRPLPHPRLYSGMRQAISCWDSMLL